jgi:hypothetical protein
MPKNAWLTCSDPREMPRPTSIRKERLLAVAYCRCCEALMRAPEHRAALDVAERFADGHATEAELTECGQRLYHLPNPFSGDNSESEIRRWALASAVHAVLDPFTVHTDNIFWHLDRSVLPDGFWKPLADLCRDVCGEPHEPINPPWLFAESAASARWLPQLARWRFDERCRTETAIALARQMYDSREFGAMPILADALQDAGCDNPAILDHCRDANQPHVRGCWVCDLVLGFS